MAETTTNTTSKPKPKPVAVSAPTFEMPKFEMPKMEVPAPFREFAEKGVAQARENYEKMKSTAEDATKVLEDSYATASQGCSGYGLKLIETARTNSNATFDMKPVSSSRTLRYSRIAIFSSWVSSGPMSPRRACWWLFGL